MQVNYAVILACLLLVGTPTENYEFSLTALHKFSKENLKILRKSGFLSALGLRPHILLIPYIEPQLRKVVVVTKSSYHRPVFCRRPKIMEGIDPARLARDWPHSVTPGGPGPEWW